MIVSYQPCLKVPCDCIVMARYYIHVLRPPRAVAKSVSLRPNTIGPFDEENYQPCFLRTNLHIFRNDTDMCWLLVAFVVTDISQSPLPNLPPI